MTTSFCINGKEYAVNLNDLPADISLNTFIRDHAGLPATKFMCQEGGCGVCICVVSGKHPVSGEMQTWAVNSCLTLLNSCTNWEIITSEGLGNKSQGYHAIQKRLAKMNGTQCGYCSPGFVMNMHGLMAANNSKLTMAEIENAFGGNICRCTGYRPILDAMKSFAVDSNIEIPDECRDIEDLGAKNCPKTGQVCAGACKPKSRSPLSFADGSSWFWPKSLPEIFEAFDEVNASNYMLVCGNTAHGVYRRQPQIKNFIDVNGVEELHQHSISADSLVLGANLSLTETMEIFKKAAKLPGFEYCQQLWQHFDLIANLSVRNMGSLIGNLCLKQQHPEFPSDIFILFEALNVKLVLLEACNKQTLVSISEFMTTSMKKTIAKAFVLSPYAQEKYIFGSYKIMPCAQNAHAYVNAAFLFEVEKPSYKVLSANICFGGINPSLAHVSALEQLYLSKNLFDWQVAEQAFSVLDSVLQADCFLPDASPEYRQKVALGLFYKFLLHNAPPTALPSKLLSGGELLQRGVSSGRQTFETNPNSYPVTKPTEKHEGLLQTAGEATYTNDLPAQHQQVWLAFVTAKKVGATVTAVDASEALKQPGVVAYFDSKDIPGENCVAISEVFFFPDKEELFATGPIQFYNQPIGVIVAESNDLAAKAAELVKISYSSEAATELLSCLQDVLCKPDAGNRIQHVCKSPIVELQVNENYDIAETGQLDMGQQYHYCLEPQTTVAVPFEGGLQVYSATQWMDLLQRTVAKFLNLKNNEIQVQVRRLGGGYGGKGTRCTPAACAAALVAYKLNRPARFVQSLESMMHVLGKRSAYNLKYDFHAKNNGKIVAIKSEFYEDVGYLSNESYAESTVMLSKNCYQFADNYKLDGYLVLTDAPSSAACRAPGGLEGIALIETIMEHIAFVAGQDAVDVRMANMLPQHKMGEMLPQFIKSYDYRQRKDEIAGFNKQNRWRKKGMGLAVMEYQIGYFGEYPATVAIYNGDGTVIIAHGGIEMGQGMNTKLAQVAAYTLGIPLDMIKFERSDTMNGANSMVTGGSVGSELLCYAVRKCCNTLNERLKPVKEELKEPKWQDLIAEAYNRKIHMIASEDCKQEDMNPYTLCALCLTEVEMDMITGNYLISRVDLLEDAGESLNPNVDIGQIEGAFMMGLGYWTTEQIIVDRNTGELKTNRTWNYKPPGAKDIPIDFRIELMPNAAHSAGFMSSKATGEPAICLSVSVVFAMQEALQSARSDAGLPKKWINLSAPMTPEHVLLSSGLETSMLKFQ